MLDISDLEIGDYLGKLFMLKLLSFIACLSDSYSIF